MGETRVSTSLSSLYNLVCLLTVSFLLGRTRICPWAMLLHPGKGRQCQPSSSPWVTAIKAEGGGIGSGPSILCTCLNTPRVWSTSAPLFNGDRRHLTEGRVQAVISTGSSYKRITSTIKRDFGRHRACSASLRQMSTEQFIVFCHSPWLPETVACTILPKRYLIPALLIKSQPRVRNIKEYSTGSRHPNAIACDFHNRGLPWWKELDAKTCTAGGVSRILPCWRIVNLQLRNEAFSLRSAHASLEPVSSHHCGVYYSKAFKEPELISLLLIQP